MDTQCPHTLGWDGLNVVGFLANALSIPPGKYARKSETQRN